MIINSLAVLYSKFRTLVLYGVIGCCSASIDFLVYTFLLKNAGLNYIIANCFSVLIGIVTSFILNSRYNFKVKDHVFRRFFIFLIVGLCGLLMSNLILYLSIEVILLNDLLSKFISIVFVVLIQFVINKYVTFKY